MDDWNEYLAAQGASARPDDTAPAAANVGPLPVRLDSSQLGDGFVAILHDRGLIAVSGDDAASFLHNQLTNDVEHLGADEVRLAAYCTPKGRMQASFLMWRDANLPAVYLQLAKELQPALQKRLSMFVLRAKAKLSDAGAAVVTLGLGGAAAGAALQAITGELPPAPYSKREGAAGAVIRVADAFGAPRYLWVTSPAQARAAIDSLTATLRLAGDQAWNLADIHAGVPLITAKTVEQFVPQMVNFELLGGVNFKKGCYPGQEIVARSQYLGKLKRRTALASVAGPIPAQAGDEVFAEDDPGQPCGMVVNAAWNGEGNTDVLVELKLAALGGAAIHLGAVTGAPLRLLPMPYPLDPIEV